MSTRSRALPYVDIDINDEGPKCNPWKEPVKCPLLLYIALIILGLILNFIYVSRLPTVDRLGRPISNNQRWVAIILGIIIYLAIALLFGTWMYRNCVNCNTGGSWIIFLLAIFFPLILWFILAIIYVVITGIGLFNITAK